MAKKIVRKKGGKKIAVGKKTGGARKTGAKRKAGAKAASGEKKPPKPPIMPILTTQDVINLEVTAARQVVAFDHEETPMVSFVRVSDDGVDFASWEKLESSGTTFEELEAKAMENLLARDDRPSWEPSNIDFEGQTVTVLSRKGDDFTGSDLLDQEMMAIAQNYYGTEHIFVGLPTRNVMLAADSDLYIAELIREFYENAEDHEQEALTPLVFRMQGGYIMEAAEVDAIPTWERPEPQLFNLNDKNALWFTMSCENFDELYDAVQYEYRAYGPGFREWANFQGTVVFDQQVPIKMGKAEHADLADLEAYMVEIAQENGWVSPYGDPIEIQFKLAKEKSKKPRPSGGKGGIKVSKRGGSGGSGGGRRSSPLISLQVKTMTEEAAAAVAIICTQQDEVLLLQRSNNPADPWSGHLALPGGMREHSDPNLLATCIRETREECWLSLSEDDLVRDLVGTVLKQLSTL